MRDAKTRDADLKLKGIGFANGGGEGAEIQEEQEGKQEKGLRDGVSGGLSVWMYGGGDMDRPCQKRKKDWATEQ